jgi:hypothetical protein
MPRPNATRSHRVKTLCLYSALNLQYTEFRTKFLTQIRQNSLCSYAVFVPNYVNNWFSTRYSVATQSRNKYRTFPILKWRTHKRKHSAWITGIKVTTDELSTCRWSVAHAYCIPHTGTDNNHGRSTWHEDEDYWFNTHGRRRHLLSIVGPTDLCL